MFVANPVKKMCREWRYVGKSRIDVFIKRCKWNNSRARKPYLRFSVVMILLTWTYGLMVIGVEIGKLWKRCHGNHGIELSLHSCVFAWVSMPLNNLHNASHEHLRSVWIFSDDIHKHHSWKWIYHYSHCYCEMLCEYFPVIKRILRILNGLIIVLWIISSPDSKVHGANMGPIWGRQDPSGPHDGPMDFDIWIMY